MSFKTGQLVIINKKCVADCVDQNSALYIVSAGVLGMFLNDKDKYLSKVLVGDHLLLIYIGNIIALPSEDYIANTEVPTRMYIDPNFKWTIKPLVNNPKNQLMTRPFSVSIY